MPALRGRATQVIRPGYMCKSVLSGTIPLLAGPEPQYVDNACITDLHNTYKELIRRENSNRPKSDRLHGMTYESFVKFFKFAQLLGLVELVKEEPMLFPPGEKQLFSMRKNGDIEGLEGMSTVFAVRRYFRLTDNGKAEERAWGNLCRAWMESWPIPSVSERIEVPPTRIEGAEEVEVKEVKPTPITRAKKVVEFVPIRLSSKPTPRQLDMLVKHLRDLSVLGVDDKRVIDELERLQPLIGDWQLAIEDIIKAEPQKAKKMMSWYESLTDVIEYLGKRDLKSAIEEIESMLEE